MHLMDKPTEDQLHAAIMGAWESVPGGAAAPPPRPRSAPAKRRAAAGASGDFAASPAAAASPTWRVFGVDELLSDEAALPGFEEVMRRQIAASRSSRRRGRRAVPS